MASDIQIAIFSLVAGPILIATACEVAAMFKKK